jgi:hypothetical protein
MMVFGNALKNRYDGTKSDGVTILQLSISDKIAINLCSVR